MREGSRGTRERLREKPEPSIVLGFPQCTVECTKADDNDDEDEDDEDEDENL